MLAAGSRDRWCRMVKKRSPPDASPWNVTSRLRLDHAPPPPPWRGRDDFVQEGGEAIPGSGQEFRVDALCPLDEGTHHADQLRAQGLERGRRGGMAQQRSYLQQGMGSAHETIQALRPGRTGGRRNARRIVQGVGREHRSGQLRHALIAHRSICNPGKSPATCKAIPADVASCGQSSSCMSNAK